jgi:hypothetical protein
MLHLVFGFLWHSAFAQFGISGLILAACVATYIYIPLPGIRHLAISIASVCVVLLFLGPKFYLEGVNHEKARWTAAEQKARNLGDAARADAIRDVSSGLRDPFDDDSR